MPQIMPFRLFTLIIFMILIVGTLTGCKEWRNNMLYIKEGTLTVRAVPSVMATYNGSAVWYDVAMTSTVDKEVKLEFTLGNGVYQNVIVNEKDRKSVSYKLENTNVTLTVKLKKNEPITVRLPILASAYSPDASVSIFIVGLELHGLTFDALPAKPIAIIDN